MLQNELAGGVVDADGLNVAVEVGEVELVGDGIRINADLQRFVVVDADVGSIDLVEVGDAVAELGVGVVVEVAAFADHLHDLRGGVAGHGLPQTGAHAGRDGRGQAGAVGELKHVERVVAGCFHTLGDDVGLHTAVVGVAAGGETGDDAVGGAGAHAQDVEGIAGTADVVELAVAVVAGSHTDDDTFLSKDGGATRGDAVNPVHVLVGDVILRKVREHAIA